MRLHFAVMDALDWLAWLFCEAAFRTDCWGPFRWSYSLGCWIGGKACEHGERHGLFVLNPRRDEPDEPYWIDARDAMEHDT